MDRLCSYHKGPCFLVLVLCLALSTLAWQTSSQAAVTRVVVDSSGTMGTFGGREYVWVTADMEGTVTRADGTAGHYRVPITLMYPDRDPNRVGFVDVVNSADFWVHTEETAPFGGRKIYYVGDTLFSDYLRREGYIYLAVQWSRMVTEVLGADYGVIEDGRDGYAIIQDAASLLRNLDEFETGLPTAPMAVGNVVGFGLSQTASFLMEFLREGHNRRADRSLVFDGILVVGQEGCLVLNNNATPRVGPGPENPTFHEMALCDGPFPTDGKLISILTESEVAHLARAVRHDRTPDSFRQYELAGVAHIPPDLVGLGQTGAKRQNPISFRPVCKAMLRNLVDWIDTGMAPPDPRRIDGKVENDGQFTFAADDDGNVSGGVRLPHMPTVLPSGENVGAPLGVYAGIDWDFLGHQNVYALIGGTFEPFSPEDLARRYPGREDYVRRVEGAAAALLADRFILEEDYQAYVAAAQRVLVGPDN